MAKNEFICDCNVIHKDIVENTKKGLNSFGYFNTDTPLYLNDTQPLARKTSNNFVISLPNSANINSLQDLQTLREYNLSFFYNYSYAYSLSIKFSFIIKHL